MKKLKRRNWCCWEEHVASMVSQFAFYVGNLIGRDLISSLAGWHAVQVSLLEE
jgi:hypothetical protein